MIKEAVAQVRAKLSDEEASKVSDLLSKIEREGNDLSAELSAANHESKTRKDTIRGLKADIESSGDSDEDFKAKIAKLESEIEANKGIKEEYEGFKTKQFEESKAKFDKIVEGLTVKETDSKYDTYKKILDDFKLGDDLTADDIQANLKVYSYVEKYGGLEIDKEKFEDGKHQQGKDDGLSQSAFEAFQN